MRARTRLTRRSVRLVTPSDADRWTHVPPSSPPHRPDRHPPVVIDGCRATEPADGAPTDFADSFADRAAAAGVSGTEMTPEQELAGRAMELSPVEFANGAGVQRAPGGPRA